MFFNLLEGEANGGGNNGGNWLSIGLIIALVAVMVVAMFFMNRRSKKQREEAEQLINAVKPGNKVKTIGGVCGIVVEVDAEENTFVLETGSETTGKCFMKFDRQAILQSDAVVEKTAAQPEAAKEEPFEDKPREEVAGQPAEENDGKAE